MSDDKFDETPESIHRIRNQLQKFQMREQVMIKMFPGLVDETEVDAEELKTWISRRLIIKDKK